MFCYSKNKETFFSWSQISESQIVRTCLNYGIKLEDLPADRIVGLEVTKKVELVHRLNTILFTAWNKIPSAAALKHSFIPIT